MNPQIACEVITHASEYITPYITSVVELEPTGAAPLVAIAVGVVVVGVGAVMAEVANVLLNAHQQQLQQLAGGCS